MGCFLFALFMLALGYGTAHIPAARWAAFEAWLVKKLPKASP